MIKICLSSLAVVVLAGAVVGQAAQTKQKAAPVEKAKAAQSSCAEQAKAESAAKSQAAASQDCCEAEAAAKAEAKAQDECCKSTEAKPMAKGDPGCCNEKGAPAKFKVYLYGGYKFFGCEDSAAKAREDMLAKGLKPGPVQKVTSKAKIA
jgi:hypothetical protein